MAKAPRTAKAKAAAQTAANTPAADTPAATPAPAAAPPAARKPDDGLLDVKVASASPQGRRRAGFGFGPEPVALRVSEEVLAQLEGDPQLIVKRG